MTLMQNNEENKYLSKVYRNITCLGIFLHLFYAILYGFLHHPIPFIYNVLDVLFYFSLMILVTKCRRYALTVVLIHLETILFCVIHTTLFGWETAFYIYLVAMASLVYFCPFRAPYIPYLFSLLHILVFFLMYIYTESSPTHITSKPILMQIFFICNNIAAFIIILYVGYVSKASASVGQKELIAKNKDLQLLTQYDQMTGLYNRVYLKKRYPLFQNNQCVLAIGDIDDFKLVNDTHGHICGDFVLQELADQMRSRLDPNTFLCRWGGEEFVLVFSNYSLDEAKQHLTEFIRWIQDYQFQYQNQVIHITLTFGITVGDSEITLDQWIEKSDQLLYKGKVSGKNVILSN